MQNKDLVRLKKVKKALRALTNFKLECSINVDRFPIFFEEGYRQGDENYPFFTEATLYLLFGKEDGRTILALIRNLATVAGVDLYSGEDEELYGGL